MTPRVVGRLAWSLWVVAVVIAAASFVVLVAAGFAFPEDTFGFPGFAAVVGIAYATVGALVASRRPSNAIGWLFLALGLLSTVQELVTAYAVLSFEQATNLLPGAIYAAWTVDWIWVPIVGGILIFVFLLFPQGRLPARAGWTVAVLGAVSMILAVAGPAFGPGPLEIFAEVDNPLALSGGTAVEEVSEVGLALFVLAGLLAVIGMIRRWWRATGVERQQYKWLLAAGLLVALTLALNTVFELLDEERLWPFAQLLLVLGFTAIPVAVGISILRHRLYEIDTIINRAAVYGALTATLAATYVGSVLLLQLALSGLTSGSDLAIAVSTLAVAAAFRPARARIQEGVDRRFFRRKYDARRTLESFSARLRDEVDLAALDAELRGVVAETMQPAHVSLWLRLPEARP